MCIRDSIRSAVTTVMLVAFNAVVGIIQEVLAKRKLDKIAPVSYTHLRAHETVLDLVCRLLLEKKKNTNTQLYYTIQQVKNKTNQIV